MIRGEKFVGLLEQAMNEKSEPARAGVLGYERTLRRMLGIVEGTHEREARIDHQAREFSPKEVSLGELWRAFRPRRFHDGDMPAAMAMAQEETRRQRFTQLAEAEGHVVLPSHFANISAFSATVSGLLDAMIMEGYGDPVFVADQFFTEEDSRMSGGKGIGVMNDGEGGDNLANGEAYPTVGLKETSIVIPENQRRGNTIQINELDFIYDRTGLVQERAVNAGTAIRRFKEIACAKTFLGITGFNSYTRDGVTGTAYQKTAGFVPVNYVNSVGSIPLTGFAQVDIARQTMNGNRDPGTGFEISIPTPTRIAVMDQREMNIMTIARATEVERRSTDQTVISRAANPLYSIEPVILPRLYYNLLVASGVSTTDALDRWYAGDWKRAFRYRKIIPFESREAPLSSEDVRRDIVLIRIAREIGTPFICEPRWACMRTKEA